MSVPDFQVDGTTASANAINQQTVSEARRYVYLHPDDVLSDRIRLPEPVARSRMSTSNIERLISEDGLFPAAGPPPPRTLAGDGDGVTLSDVPWPIPGRVRRGKPVS